jgi:hypothetical protein
MCGAIQSLADHPSGCLGNFKIDYSLNYVKYRRVT